MVLLLVKTLLFYTIAPMGFHLGWPAALHAQTVSTLNSVTVKTAKKLIKFDHAEAELKFQLQGLFMKGRIEMD